VSGISRSNMSDIRPVYTSKEATYPPYLYFQILADYCSVEERETS
jgi:hypothetical protein